MKALFVIRARLPSALLIVFVGRRRGPPATLIFIKALPASQAGFPIEMVVAFVRSGFRGHAFLTT